MGYMGYVAVTKKALRKKQRRKRDRVLAEAKMCNNKQTYYTTSDANQAIRIVGREGGPAMRYYMCPHCSRYHITSSVLKSK